MLATLTPNRWRFYVPRRVYRDTLTRWTENAPCLSSPSTLRQLVRRVNREGK